MPPDHRQKAAEYDYDRTAAPRRKAPAVRPEPTPPDDEERVVAATESAVKWALYDDDWERDALKHFRAVGEDRFSDGTPPQHNDGSLGFAFTMRYPETIVAEGRIEVDLASVPATVHKELGGRVGNAVIDAVLPTVNLGKALLMALRDRITWSAADLRDDFKDKVYQVIDENTHQSIEAYSHEEEKVELAEYPSVYLRYLLERTADEFGTPEQHGTKWSVPVRVTWKVKATRWAFDSDKLSKNLARWVD